MKLCSADRQRAARIGRRTETVISHRELGSSTQRVQIQRARPGRVVRHNGDIVGALRDIISHQ